MVNKEAALIIGVLMAVLGILGIAVTPEHKESIEYLVVAFVSLGGVALIRQFVASKFSVMQKAGKEAHDRVFNNRR